MLGSFWGNFLVMLGSLFGNAGVISSSFLEHVGMCFGRLWGGFRLGLGRFVEQKSYEVENIRFSNVSGSMFPASGRPKQLCLIHSRTPKYQQILP